MASRAEPETQPEHPRRLGRSRTYTAEDVSKRLSHWHAPRVNRWEQLQVTDGTLGIEYSDATGVTKATLSRGEKRWFAPGVRWRVARMETDSRFELEVHADSKGQAEAPQLLRSDLLERAERAERVTVANPEAFTQCLRALSIGERRLITTRFPEHAIPRAPFAAHELFRHPLAANSEGSTVFVARSNTRFDLAGYLGLDHAVIEAALGEALAGDAEHDRWLRAALARHLHIEEALIFPAYVEAGGREAWVRGLRKEHDYLRQYLGELDQPDSRRKFLRLLDGHDEKEERVVYPDILEHLGECADELLDAALTTPIPTRFSPSPAGRGSG
jgi:tellurite resistance-related uncharacterized protein